MILLHYKLQLTDEGQLFFFFVNLSWSTLNHLSFFQSKKISLSVVIELESMDIWPSFVNLMGTSNSVELSTAVIWNLNSASYALMAPTYKELLKREPILYSIKASWESQIREECKELPSGLVIFLYHVVYLTIWLRFHLWEYFYSLNVKPVQMASISIFIWTTWSTICTEEQNTARKPLGKRFKYSTIRYSFRTRLSRDDSE